MNRLFKKFIAFSLVELMISLITISLISAAFAPVITKKLSASTITVGSFGGGTSSYTGEPRSQEDCDKISTSLMFISASESGNPKNLCVTRYNIGDHADLQIPTSAVPAGNIFNAGSGDSKCWADDVTPCCWIGNTAGSNCDSANGSYSGCNRTVCNWEAADNICKMLNVKNQTGFRLPTQTELGNLNPATYSKLTSSYAGDDGLMFCDRDANYNSARCSGAQVCLGSYDGYCYPNHVWSSTLDGSANAFRRALGSGSWLSYSDYRTSLFSVRCVIDNITIEESGGSSVDMNSFKKTMCGMLDTKYWDESEKACKTCSDDIPNCEKCSNSTTCKKCEDGYTLTDGKCTHWCSGSKMMKVDNLCVTKCNMGDCGLPLNHTEGTCWKPNSTCTDYFTGYSGCNRTLCNFQAAYQICMNANIDGIRFWRLPHANEIENWYQNSLELGENGLQLCDGGNSTKSNLCPTIPGACNGSWSNNCAPAAHWTDTKNPSSTSTTYIFTLFDEAKGVAPDLNIYAFSVRCVKEL